jgi:hypothetical protein
LELGAAPRRARSCAAPRTAPHCSAWSCVATLRVALSSALSSKPHCSATPRTARSRAAAPRTARSGAATQLHEEGDGSYPSPSSSWGYAAAPCFFFLATLCCSIAAFFFLFSCCYATELPSPSYMVGIFFLALLLLML